MRIIENKNKNYSFNTDAVERIEISKINASKGGGQTGYFYDIAFLQQLDEVVKMEGNTFE